VDAVSRIRGAVPWRCAACGKRFRARPIPLSHLFYAHCGICGNMELKQIAAEHVRGATGMIGRIFGLQALRCEPCRNKFVSVRPLKREERETVTSASS